MNETRRVLKRFSRLVGSIYFGAALMTILAVAMGWATFIEREMGTPVARRIIYSANWFYSLIGLLGFNILSSALVRAPRFIRRQKVAFQAETPVANEKSHSKIIIERSLIPFYLAHLGVLVLLIGCWTTARRGVQARTIIPEGTAVEKAVDVDSRLFEIELSDPSNPDAEPEKIEIPFSGGPLDWRDLDSAKNWNDNVAAPVLESMGEGSFFKDLGKSAARTSQKVAYWAAKISCASRPQKLYDGKFRFDVLDYSTTADYVPVAPLKLELKLRKPTTDSGAASPVEKRLVELAFPFDPNAEPESDPLSTSRRAKRLTLPDGERIVWILADSNAEFDAFSQLAPQNDGSINQESATDCVVLLVDGRRFQIPLNDLAPLSRLGDPTERRESLETERDEIVRRLKIERERAASSEFDASSEKPLQTIAEKELVESSERFDKASAELAKIAGVAERNSVETPKPSESSELRAARSDFVKQRVLNYLTSNWKRLESAIPTSAEFCETLEKMAEENAARLVDVERLERAATLGDSGWKISAFELSPTLVSGVDELQGWTAFLQLRSPRGAALEATLFSELGERNRYSEPGRIFGALWSERAKGADAEYGRSWNAALGKPKFELIQSPSGALVYRYVAAVDDVQTACVFRGDQENARRGEGGEEGRVAFKPRPLDSVAALAFDGEISLSNAENPDCEIIESVSIQQVALQDELGARLVPTSFKKETANEFYGKAKIRVSFGESASETFWLRTIPLESATPEQIKFLTKTFSVDLGGERKTMKIRLVDREFPLDVALFVKNFTPQYEPGSSTAASFASVVRVLAPGLSPKKQAESIAQNPENDVCIQMNRPGVLQSPNSKRKYWAYQDSFRGPFKPGDKEFDEIVDGKLLPGETKPRESLYYTIITLNDDPGRGLKYFGALLIVWGTALLVYRKKGNANVAATASGAQCCAGGASIEIAAPEESERMNAKTLPTKTTVLSLFIAAFLAATSTVANARETSSQPAVENRVDSGVASKSVRTDSFDWSSWRLLPVFDGGRRQPLEAFARILVRDVCGTDAPTLAVSNEVFERLESDKPLNFPELAEFLKDVADADKEKQTAWYAEISADVVSSQKEIAAKIRATFPGGVRKFSAAELLFSWIVEPEMWEFVPFVDDAKGAIAKGALKRSDVEIALRLGRLAPEDFERQDLKTRRFLIDDYRSALKKRASKASTATLQRIDDAERRVSAFRSVAFIPTRSPSTRPRYYLNKILFGAAPTETIAFHPSSASLISRLAASSKALERLLTSEDSAIRKTSPFSNKDFLLRKTTPVSRANSASDSRRTADSETLLLARQINLLANVYGDYPLWKTGPLFENLYLSSSAALDELRRHRDEIFASETFSKEYRQELSRVVSALSETVDNIELAYASLVVEPSKALNVAPLVRRGGFRLTESQESPWLALQTLLWAPDSLYSRFVDPRSEVVADGASASRSGSDFAADELAISPFATFDEALRKTLDSSRVDRAAANAFFAAATAYRDKAAPDRAERFNLAIQRFADEVRSLAAASEPIRAQFANEEIPDEARRAEFLAKTAYPASGALDAELFYYRLNPFFWNWIACLLAVVAFLLSFLRQGFKRVFADSDSQIAAPEIFFFSLGLIFLAASVVVAFWGGAIRAYITGWAPVTNMFETVVLLALMIAAIAIGSALYPIWGEPLGSAWRAAAFPLWRRDEPDARRFSRLLCVPRVALIVLCVVATAKICYSEEVFGRGLIETIRDSFAMQGILDRVAVVATFAFVAWSVPRFLVASFALVFFSRKFLPAGESVGSFCASRYLEVVRRKGFLTSSSVVALLVAASAYFNSSEFNPNIRPLVAVLRSNFWLTIHVFAVIASYALASIAWAVSLTSLSAYIFGRYSPTSNAAAVGVRKRKRDKNRNDRRGKKGAPKNESIARPVFASSSATEAQSLEPSASLDDWEPALCRRVAPILAATIRGAVLFLTIGIILGARWADFSWGRFWSWDPKEVWALATLLVYLVVLHALKSRSGKRFGLAVGATLGAIAVVTTWYGLSFVMGGGGRHAYAAGESNKVAIVYVAFALNVGWVLLATVRYAYEKSRRRRTNPPRRDDARFP